jgi:hypothetical protein
VNIVLLPHFLGVEIRTGRNSISTREIFGRATGHPPPCAGRGRSTSVLRDEASCLPWMLTMFIIDTGIQGRRKQPYLA